MSQRVYRKSEVGVIPVRLGYADDIETAKALAEMDATKRRKHGRYFMESVHGEILMTVRQLRGEYRVLEVTDPRPRTDAEIERVMSRFGGEDDFE